MNFSIAAIFLIGGLSQVHSHGTEVQDLYPANIQGTFSDTTAPTIKIDGVDCQDHTVNAVTCGGSSAATWVTTAEGDCDFNPSLVSTTHVSGNLFPVGNTLVTVKYVDNRDNVATCAFTVSVNACPSTSPTVAPTNPPTGTPRTTISNKPSNAPTNVLRSKPSKDPTSRSSDTPVAVWSITDTSTHRHRHLEDDNLDCLLVERETQFENHIEREGISNAWVCEFPHQVAMDRLNGRSFIDIVTDDVLTIKVIDEKGAQSGASLLKTTGAYIEESLDTGEMKMNIPNTATLEVISLPDTHDRHYKQRRRLNNAGNGNGGGGGPLRSSRSLISPNPGTLSILVIKVIDSNGVSNDADEAQLKNDVFDDEYSLKTGYASCSKDQLIIEPAANRPNNDGTSSITNGITTISINVAASFNTHYVVRGAVEAQARKEYGNISSDYDLVMICLPPGTGNWLAYAYVNSWLSVCNNNWCRSVSVQMHEIGHNIGFGHSNKDGRAYRDQSCIMGYGYNKDDGPKQCFNAAKNFQTGWYTNAQESFDPLQNKNSVVDFVLNGITDYQVNGSNNDQLVTLRLVEFGETFGNDYYLGYNLKAGINEGTLQAANEVILFEKNSGGPTNYGESNRIADLIPGQSYTIYNFGGTVFDVTIRVKPYTNSGRDAPIEITTLSDGVPTESPTISCGSSNGNGRFSIALNTGNYNNAISWKLIENDSNMVIESAPRTNHRARSSYFYPIDGSHYCLESNKCYTFKIEDRRSNAPYNGQGNYKIYLDNEIVFEGGGVEKFQASYSFCIGTSTEPSFKPSQSPSDVPSFASSHDPSSKPSTVPSFEPSTMPSSVPTMTPSTTVAVLFAVQPSVTAVQIEEGALKTARRIAGSSTNIVVRQRFLSNDSDLDVECDPAVILCDDIAANSNEDVTNSTCYNVRCTLSSSTVNTADAGVAIEEAVGTGDYATKLFEESGIYATLTLPPSEEPSSLPSSGPSIPPSFAPSDVPSSAPSPDPSSKPTVVSSLKPSFVPSGIPSAGPSSGPSLKPSQSPSDAPSTAPSFDPSATPSLAPSAIPSAYPSADSSASPSAVCSSDPITVGAGSCIGPGTNCQCLAIYVGANSCLGGGACVGVSKGSIAAGSCTNKGACYRTTGVIAAGSCTGKGSCYKAGGVIAAGSCTGEGSCWGTKSTFSSAAGSCTGKNSCKCSSMVFAAGACLTEDSCSEECDGDI